MTKTKTLDYTAVLFAGILGQTMAVAPVPTAFAQAPPPPHPERPGPREGAPRVAPGRPESGVREGGGQERGGPAAERRSPSERGEPGRGEAAHPPAPAMRPDRAPDDREIRRQDEERRAQEDRERRGESRGPAQGVGPGPAGGPPPGAPGEHRFDNGPGPAGGPPPGGPNERRLGNGPGPAGGPPPDARDERRFGNGPRPAGGPPPGARDERRFGNGQDRGPVGAAAIGAAAGFAGGFMAGTAASRLDDIRRDRREVREGDRTFVREPGRTIVEEGDRRFILHDPEDRFRELGYRVDRLRRGADFVDRVVVPGGDTILTYTTADGRLLRRVRRGRDGREVVLFVNNAGPLLDDVVVLPPPPLRIARDLYMVDYAAVDAAAIYAALIAPPLAPLPQRYTLDQVVYSPDLRAYVRAVDIDTINFDTGSWVVPSDQAPKLAALAQSINKAIDRDPNSVFLIEGYTDATGNPTDNLSLSDRRAQSVGAILTRDFNVPPQNLTTQGYGDQNLKVNTAGPSAANRRVVVRNITQLLAAGGAPPQ